MFAEYEANQLTWFGSDKLWTETDKPVKDTLLTSAMRDKVLERNTTQKKKQKRNLYSGIKACFW